MTVIRGATTIDSDCKKDISAAVKELLDEIFAQNKADKTEIRCIVFSLTTDIHSYHPAKAARECGYDFAPLFACTEPDIRGGLALCVRAMIFAEFSAARPASIKRTSAKNTSHAIATLSGSCESDFSAKKPLFFNAPITASLTSVLCIATITFFIFFAAPPFRE